MFVYLCGPMAENTPEQADGWRQDAAVMLEMEGFKVSSPMRMKGMLKSDKVMGVHYEAYGDVPELTPPSIVTRDQFDVRHADVILANMTEVGTAVDENSIPSRWVKIPSIGSDFEIAWAIILNKPVVLIAPDGNPYADHPFLVGGSGIVRFKQLDEGINWIVRNFGIYTEEDRS